MFNPWIKKIRIMFEVFSPVNSNQIQEGHLKLKTLVEFHSLEIAVRVSFLILKTSNISCITSSYAERA